MVFHINCNEKKRKAQLTRPAATQYVHQICSFRFSNSLNFHSKYKSIYLVSTAYTPLTHIILPEAGWFLLPSQIAEAIYNFECALCLAIDTFFSFLNTSAHWFLFLRGGKHRDEWNKGKVLVLIEFRLGDCRRRFDLFLLLYENFPSFNNCASINARVDMCVASCYHNLVPFFSITGTLKISLNSIHVYRIHACMHSIAQLSIYSPIWHT